MSLFQKIFRIFDKNKPHAEFVDFYSEINELAVKIQIEANLLRKMQKEIVELRVASSKKAPSGGIGLSKTESIEEELVPQLKILAEITEKRFLNASEKIKGQEPFSAEEQFELNEVISLLKKVEEYANSNNLIKLAGREKLKAIESRLRETDTLLRKFHASKKYAKELVREVKDHEISPLLKKVFKQATSNNLFSAEVTQKNLEAIFLESEKINACQDQKWRIVWRKWYQSVPPFEVDEGNEIGPHVNVDIVLNGKKKSMHLIKAA